MLRGEAMRVATKWPFFNKALLDIIANDKRFEASIT